MSKLRKILKYITICSIILSLFAASELVYIYNNHPKLIGLYYLWLAKKNSSTNFSLSLSYLEKSIVWNSKVNTKITENELPEYTSFNTTTKTDNNEFKSEYTLYLKSKIENIISMQATDIAKIYYGLGLIAYNNNEPELATGLVRGSIYLNPDLSYYFVELANIYLKEGNQPKAVEIMEYCSKFEAPSKHCGEYKSNNFDKYSPLEVGYFKELIDASH